MFCPVLPTSNQSSLACKCRKSAQSAGRQVVVVLYSHTRGQRTHQLPTIDMGERLNGLNRIAHRSAPPLPPPAWFATLPKMGQNVSISHTRGERQFWRHFFPSPSAPPLLTQKLSLAKGRSLDRARSFVAAAAAGCGVTFCTCTFRRAPCGGWMHFAWWIVVDSTFSKVVGNVSTHSHSTGCPIRQAGQLTLLSFRLILPKRYR